MDCAHFVTFLLCSKPFGPAAPIHPLQGYAQSLHATNEKRAARRANPLAEFTCRVALPDVDVTDRLRLDVPVGQAGMGAGLAGATLAAAVAKAGGLGTIGITTPRQLRTSIDVVREQAPGRAVPVNLLMPFVRRHHVAVCVDARMDVVVLALCEKRRLVEQFRDAGTRFLLTHEANANRECQRRIINADKTIETNLFGFGWPLLHRVAPNAATRRWCDDDGEADPLSAALNAASRPLSVLGYLDAGETALRIGELTSAGQAVKDLSPRYARPLAHQRERKTVPVLGPHRLDHRRVQPRVITHHLQRLPRRQHSGVIGMRLQDPAITNDVVYHND
jgi:hypothetical protein